MDCGGTTCLPDRQAPLSLHPPPTVGALELSHTEHWKLTVEWCSIAGMQTKPMNKTPARVQAGAPLPEVIRTEDELDEILTRPRPVLLECMRQVTSPLVVLGAGGKMGPTLAVLAKRAATDAGLALEVIAVSRFTSDTARNWLETRGVKTVSSDLLER